MSYYFTVCQNPSGQWYWEFTREGGNGVIATSAFYHSKAVCVEAIHLLQAQAQQAKIEVKTLN